MKQYQTIKIWKETLSKLRLLAGIREQSIVKIINKLVEEALEENGKRKEEKTRAF